MANSLSSLGIDRNIIDRHCVRQSSSHSSHMWLERQKKDVYVKMSRYENYRARSAFKLKQLDDKFKFLRPGIAVLDVGAAPGSWTQVVCERLELKKGDELKAYTGSKEGENINDVETGMCIAIDIQPMTPVDGAICIGNADFTSPFSQAKLIDWLNGRKLDVILSDMAPNCSGSKSFDHESIIKLNYRLVRFANQVLKPNVGTLVSKIWDGDETKELCTALGQLFERVKIHKPPASRIDSAESYIICSKFKSK